MTTRQTRRISLAVRDVDGNALNAAVDLFPHRVELHRGTTIEDLLYWCVSCLLPYGRWHHGLHHHGIHQIYQAGYEGPFFTLAPGALVFSQDIETAENAADLHVFQDGPDKMRLPDGTLCEGSRFVPPVPLSMPDAQRRPEIMGEFDPGTFDDPLTAACFGVIAAALPCDAGARRHPLLAGEEILARMSRLVELGTPSGKLGSDQAAGAFKALSLRLESHWLIEPDRLTRPEKMVASPWLSARVDMADLAPYKDLAAGIFPVWESCKDVIPRAAAIDGKLEGGSAHERLHFREALRRLDRAIEDAAPLDLLKPAARKRAEKRRG